MIFEVFEGLWQFVLSHILILNLLLSIIIVFFQRKDPKAVWTWLFALYFIPGFGILFYLLFGQDLKKSKMFRIKEVEDRLKYSAKIQEDYLLNRKQQIEDPVVREYEGLIVYNLETSGSVLTAYNKMDILTDGEEKFCRLREDLKKAKHFIHIQYYIIKNDEVFDSIIPILMEKVKEGVEVRILYDGMGGRFMSQKKWNQLKEAGILVGVFFPPVLGRLNLRVNYRNHRKIVVIDGEIGYVGGFNIGKEYISKDEKFGYWRDTHLRIEGEAVMGLQVRFALDWNYAYGEKLFLNGKYFGAGEENKSDNREHAAEKASDNFLGIQIVASGPDTGDRHIRDNYLYLFFKAKKRIYIQTPYFVPDDAVISALIMAAKSGVDVRLMIPCKPDHPFVYWATYSYAGDLLKAGAKCYIYENGFLHAKGVCVDGQVMCYGTANMDIRSFELNFEVNATVYDEEMTRRMEEIFRRDIEHSQEITLENYLNRSMWIRIKEQVCRLLSPLL